MECQGDRFAIKSTSLCIPPGGMANCSAAAPALKDALSQFQLISRSWKAPVNQSKKTDLTKCRWTGLAALAAIKRSVFAIAEGRGEGVMRMQSQFFLDKVFPAEARHSVSQ